MKRCMILCFVLLLGNTLYGCQAQPAKTSKTKQHSGKTDYVPDDDFELSLQSSVDKDQCFICGTPAGVFLDYYYKFDSIGIIHWADMSVTDTRIREPDDNGNEKKKQGYRSTYRISFGEGYGAIWSNSQPDRCVAEPHIRLGEKDTIDCESIKDQLCQDCLDTVCGFYEDQVNSDNDKYLESTGYCLIDFTTKELYTLSDPYRGYSIRDYMVRYDLKEQGDGEKYIDLLIFYAPIRETDNSGMNQPYGD